MTPRSVLFIHGMWADHAHWNRFRRHLEGIGFDTHAVTLLFHDVPQDRNGLRSVGIMDYVAQVLRELQSLPARPIVIGHSMGALVAQKVAEQEALHALVLLAPIAPGGISPIRPSVALCASANAVDALCCRPFIIPARNARYGLLNTLAPRTQSVIHKSFLYESGRALRDILMGSVVVDERRISCPVLVGVGSADRATPPAVARRIAIKYGAEYKEYEGQCHFLGASSEVIEHVASWLELLTIQ